MNESLVLLTWQKLIRLGESNTDDESDEVNVQWVNIYSYDLNGTRLEFKWNHASNFLESAGGR